MGVVLSVLDHSFRDLERCVTPAKLVSRGSYEVFRHEEQSFCVAVLQKSARLVSGLRALIVLMHAGQTQEMGVICRTLDEIGEDIMFFCQAISAGKEATDRHKEHLKNFFQEEFDVPGSPFLSSQKRGMISRDKIQSALANVEGASLNPSDGKELYRTVSKAYSGFVHAASPQIMDMYGGNPPHYHIGGMLGTPRMKEADDQVWSYLYRGLINIMFAAKCFGRAELVGKLYAFRKELEQTGRSFFVDPEAAIKKAKRADAEPGQ